MLKGEEPHTARASICIEKMVRTKQKDKKLTSQAAPGSQHAADQADLRREAKRQKNKEKRARKKGRRQEALIAREAEALAEGNDRSHRPLLVDEPSTLLAEARQDAMTATMTPIPAPVAILPVDLVDCVVRSPGYINQYDADAEDADGEDDPENDDKDEAGMTSEDQEEEDDYTDSPKTSTISQTSNSLLEKD